MTGMIGKRKRRHRLDKTKSSIVIVGSGLAGLSVAISLEQAGFANISIYERDENFESQKEGYGLTLTYNPKGPLASLGCLESAANEDCPSRSHYLFRSDGAVLGYFGNAFFQEQQQGLGQRGNLRVKRKVLRKILFQKITNSKIHWGHKFVDHKFSSSTNQYTVKFKTLDGEDVTTTADLLVAADGIHSKVLQKLYPPTVSNPNQGLRKLGIRLILGIADFSHPLLNERGFYTLDGKARLFTMPYESRRLGTKEDSKNRIMWQLSFSTDSQESTTPLDKSLLRKKVLDTVTNWHAPVKDMILATPMDSIWGTDLMDRDPKQTLNWIVRNNVRRLVVVGDALHSMSPFKGQGANQALKDGPVLAQWLQKASIDAAVNCFWREIVQRTAPVVQASRLAAKELHSPEIMNQCHGFAGIRDPNLLLSKLEEKNIRANPQLDQQITKVIETCHLACVEPKQLVGAFEQEKALHFSESGNLQGLRILSVERHSQSIRSARDADSRSCLHLAAQGGHFWMCKWLLTEVQCDPTLLDKDGKTFLAYIPESKERLLDLLKD